MPLWKASSGALNRIECIGEITKQTRYEAQQDILNYITMFYDSHRLHSYLGYKSPNQYEVEMNTLKKAA